MLLSPWSAPGAHKNIDRCKESEAPCALCGKPVKEPWEYEVRVVAGGSRFATKREFHGQDPVSDASDLGLNPLGAACARKLIKAGVYVAKF